MEKLTYSKALVNVLANAEVVNLLDNETVDKLNALKLSLDKKASGKKETSKQKENKPIKENLIEVISARPNVTIKGIQEDARFEKMSNQKISALLSQLVKEEVIVKEYDKKTPMFSIASNE